MNTTKFPNITMRNGRRIISDPEHGIGISHELKPRNGMWLQVLCLRVHRAGKLTLSKPHLFEHGVN